MATGQLAGIHWLFCTLSKFFTSFGDQERYTLSGDTLSGENFVGRNFLHETKIHHFRPTKNSANKNKSVFK